MFEVVSEKKNFILLLNEYKVSAVSGFREMFSFIARIAQAGFYRNDL